jgi:hypothetical protein
MKGVAEITTKASERKNNDFNNLASHLDTLMNFEKQSIFNEFKKQNGNKNINSKWITCLEEKGEEKEEEKEKHRTKEDTTKESGTAEEENEEHNPHLKDIHRKSQKRDCNIIVQSKFMIREKEDWRISTKTRSSSRNLSHKRSLNQELRLLSQCKPSLSQMSSEKQLSRSKPVPQQGLSVEAKVAFYQRRIKGMYDYICKQLTNSMDKEIRDKKLKEKLTKKAKYKLAPCNLVKQEQTSCKRTATKLLKDKGPEKKLKP